MPKARGYRRCSRDNAAEPGAQGRSAQELRSWVDREVFPYLDWMSLVTLMRTIVLATLWMIVLIAPSYGQNPTWSPNKLYAVVFGFVIDESGELKSFRVEKIVDPDSGSTEAVDVKVPDSYVSAARAQVMAKGYKGTLEHGTPEEMYAYFFFDPKQPDRADIQPRKRK